MWEKAKQSRVLLFISYTIILLIWPDELQTFLHSHQKYLPLFYLLASITFCFYTKDQSVVSAETATLLSWNQLYFLTKKLAY